MIVVLICLGMWLAMLGLVWVLARWYGGLWS